jgi:hypothetical protein
LITTIFALGYVLLAVWTQWQLRREDLEIYMLSFTFTTLLVACGIIKFIMVQRPDKIRQLFNSLILYESGSAAGISFVLNFFTIG